MLTLPVIWDEFIEEAQDEYAAEQEKYDTNISAYNKAIAAWTTREEASRYDCCHRQALAKYSSQGGLCETLEPKPSMSIVLIPVANPVGVSFFVFFIPVGANSKSCMVI